jgi:hypothetical protein
MLGQQKVTELHDRDSLPKGSREEDKDYEQALNNPDEAQRLLQLLMQSIRLWTDGLITSVAGGSWANRN